MVSDRARSDCLLASARAAACGWKPSCLAASRTRLRTASVLPGMPFITRDAAVRETPAARATSSSLERFSMPDKDIPAVGSHEVAGVQCGQFGRFVRGEAEPFEAAPPALVHLAFQLPHPQ